ncbi:MAG TPA: glycosyltransferase [Opitutaceae bacterium]|jgi:glycosyltransferase involved in cell wall biosynthesis|nr:glycosyltransferase [Opitutaceae bacterium]
MTANKPIISVVMPVYNADRYLQVALDSITAQTFANFELITVDDGSTDTSLKILRLHAARDPRLRVITRPNTGIVGALNDGLAVARGWFIARMDADDESAPKRFARQLGRFHSDPSLVALGSAVTFMDAAGRSVQPCPRPLLHSEIEHLLLSGDGGALIHPAVMFRASAVRAAGDYRVFQRDAQYFEDLDLYLRLARIGTLANHAEPLLRYRVHTGSINFNQHAGRRAVKLTVMREAYAARGLPFTPEQIPDDTSAHGDPVRHAREWACSSLAYGSRRVAVSHGWRAVCLSPRNVASWRALRFALTAPVQSPVRFR